METNYSVLMSVYSKVTPEELQISVDSVLRQTLKPSQFVLVCDGPLLPETAASIMNYQRQYTKLFTVYKIKENRGLPYALNVGIELSRFELIARMDCDDYSYPERCEKQVQRFIEDHNLSLLGTLTKNFICSLDCPSQRINERPIGMENIKTTIRRYSAFDHNAVMYRKSAVINSGRYDITLRRCQDHDLFSRMIYLGYKVDNIDEVLCLCRMSNAYINRVRSIDGCKARMIVQRRLLTRGQCSLLDYYYIVFAMAIEYIIPLDTFAYIYRVIKSYNNLKLKKHHS